MTMHRVLLIVSLLLLAAPSIAAETSPVLHPYVAEYELWRAGRPEGRVSTRLEAEGPGHWQMHSRTRGTQGLAALAGIDVVETSKFSATAAGVACGQYRYRQTGLRTRERSIDCGTDANGITSRDHRGEYHFPAQAGVADRQIASLALALKLAAGQRGQLTLPVADREQLESQRYRVSGEETIDLPAGQLHTIKLERLHDSGARTTTTWFAMDQGWVPARILHTGTSGSYELRLISLQR